MGCCFRVCLQVRSKRRRRRHVGTRADAAFYSAYFCSTVPDRHVREWSEPSEYISLATLTR